MSSSRVSGKFVSRMIRLSFQLVTGIVMLLAVCIIGAAAWLGYDSLSGSVRAITDATVPDPVVPRMNELVSGLFDAETSVRSFHTSRDSAALKPYTQFADELDSKLDTLRNEAQKVAAGTLANELEEIVRGKLNVMNEMLALRRDSRLGKEIRNIRRSIAASTPAASQSTEAEEEEKRGLKKLFSKKKNSSDSPPEDLRTQSDSLLRQIDQQLNSLSAMQVTEQQTWSITEHLLNQADSTLNMKLRRWEMSKREFEQKVVASKAAEAEAAALQSNRYILIFMFIAALLMLAVVLMTMEYVRRNNQQKERLRKAREEAERLAQERERFAATLSHEIRTPMHAILGFTEQMLQTAAASQRGQLSIVKNAAEHLLGMVNSVLDYARLGAGKVTMEQKPFSPARETRDACALLQYQADEKKVVLAVNIHPSVPEGMLGDAMRFRQILINLIGNAIKFTEVGSVTVTLSTEPDEDRRMQLKLSVADTGTGVPAEKAARIFEPFEQAGANRKQEYGGAGLGLPITKLLVELQGGDIALTPGRQRGSEFIIRLPIEAASLLPTADVAPEANWDLQRFAGKKVLVADDEPYNRMLLAGILNKWKVPFAEAEDGGEALRLAASGSFDLLLLDLNMPVKNGIEVTVAIRRHGDAHIASLPVVGLTASAHKERQRCLAAGMNAVMEKPFRETELMHKLHELLGAEGALSHKAIPEVKTAPDAEIDFSFLHAIAQGNSGFVKEMTDIFARTLRQGIADLEAALDSADASRAGEVAHRLLPSVQVMGAAALVSSLKEIETLAQQQAAVGILSSPISGFSREARRILQRLHEMESGNPPTLTH